MHEDYFTLSMVERVIELKPLPLPESEQNAQP